jgi:hypothetical protein
VPKDQKPVNQQPKSFYAHASPSVKGEESHIPKSVKTFPSLTVKPSILDSRFDRCRKHAARSAKPSAMKDGARHLARAWRNGGSVLRRRFFFNCIKKGAGSQVLQDRSGFGRDGVQAFTETGYALLGARALSHFFNYAERRKMSIGTDSDSVLRVL